MPVMSCSSINKKANLAGHVIITTIIISENQLDDKHFNKNFLYLSNNQLKCLSLSWCKFVIDLVMFVIDLVYVCHWLYTGRQKNSCHWIIQVIVGDLVSCWPIRTPVAHKFTSKCMLAKGCSSFILYLTLQKCVGE